MKKIFTFLVMVALGIATGGLSFIGTTFGDSFYTPAEGEDHYGHCYEAQVTGAGRNFQWWCQYTNFNKCKTPITDSNKKKILGNKEHISCSQIPNNFTDANTLCRNSMPSNLTIVCCNYTFKPIVGYYNTETKTKVETYYFNPANKEYKPTRQTPQDIECNYATDPCTGNEVERSEAQFPNDCNHMKRRAELAEDDAAGSGTHTDLPGWDLECTSPKRKIIRRSASSNKYEYRCVTECLYPYAFRSDVNDNCMECKTTKYQGINYTVTYTNNNGEQITEIQTSGVCRVCDESTQFWDATSGECISKTDTRSFIQYTRQMMAECWRCATTSLKDFQDCVNYKSNNGNINIQNLPACANVNPDGASGSSSSSTNNSVLYRTRQ